jgi:replicative superfamily II helicase
MWVVTVWVINRTIKHCKLPVNKASQLKLLVESHHILGKEMKMWSNHLKEGKWVEGLKNTHRIFRTLEFMTLLLSMRSSQELDTSLINQVKLTKTHTSLSKTLDRSGTIGFLVYVMVTVSMVTMQVITLKRICRLTLSW